MIAAVILDGQLSLAERPDPEPGVGEVRIRTRAAGLNAADLLQLAGHYPAPPGWPRDVPGLELSGVVDATGPGAEAWRGRRVCAIVGGGAQAGAAVVPAVHLLEVPDDVDLVEAGAFPEAFVTAHDALVSQADLRAGERVIITGATGGVGTAAIQVAAELGSHVIAVTRTREHHEALRSLGAAETVLIDDVAGVDKVDVALELVGAATVPAVVSRLGPRGRLVVIGVGGGARAPLDLLAVMQRRLSITGSTLRSRSVEEKAAAVAAAARDLGARWAAGSLRVPIAARLSLSQVREAYQEFAHPGRLGKLVLVVA